MIRRVYHRRFRISARKTYRIRIEPEVLAVRLPAMLERFEAAAADYRAHPDDEGIIRAFVQAICAICVCIFGEASTTEIIEGWSGNYIGLAAELSLFCQRRLAPVMRRFAANSARRYRKGRLL